MPVLQHAPSCENKRVLLIGRLHDWHIVHRYKFTATRWEVLGKQKRRSGMCGMRHGRLQAVGFNSCVADSGVVVVQLAKFCHDFRRGVIVPLGAVGPAKAGFNALCEVAQNFPVRAGLAARRNRPAHALHTPVCVCDCAVFFRPRCRRQEYICKRAGFIDEQILCHNKFQLLHVLAGLVQVGLAHHWVLAHDVQCTHATGMRVRQNFRCSQAAFAVEPAGLHVPKLLPVLRILFIVHPLVSRIKERHGAHV